jgi:MFS family permease
MMENDLSKKAAVRFVVLIGLVSLFADMTYEGARGIAGPYLAVLGANGTTVGIVAGFGELIGYGLRLFSGILSDRTGRYWAITIWGYFINLLAVPLLALAGRWETAAFLLVMERVGKAIRTPARDAMLSHATHQTGHGWGFGLHEAMDQVGATLGPLLVAVILYRQGGYGLGFSVLLIPAVLALLVLGTARFLYPRPHDLEAAPPSPETTGIPRVFWIYLAAVACLAAGYADFPLIAYHFEKVSSVPPFWISILYAIAMGVDAFSALLFGRLFDRKGFSVLILTSFISLFFAPLVFWGDFRWALAGMILWGIGMGAQESIMRAAVAEMVSKDKRGSAFGVFNAGYGLFWFLGSAVMGWLYDTSLRDLVFFSMAAQSLALPILLWARKEFKLN